MEYFALGLAAWCGLAFLSGIAVGRLIERCGR
jgi:hypothetical protein